jgi:MFS family permease
MGPPPLPSGGIPSPVRLSRRLLTVSLLFNAANYLAWSVIPARAAFDLHAGKDELGFLPVLGGVTYILAAPRVGRLSDRIPREALARFGIGGWALFCLLAWRSDSMAMLYGASILDGLAQAFVWPGLQARIGDVSGGRDLERNLGTFSLSWSLGKTLGFFGSSALVHPDPGILLGCGALALALVFLFPAPRHGHGTLPPEEDDGLTPGDRARFRMAGWIANFAGFGMGATMVYLYPGLLRDWGREPWHHGAVVGTVYLAQTAGFHLFGRWTAWHWRGGPLFAAAAAGAGALLVMAGGAPLPLALAAAAVLGLSIGLCYMASIYYSVHAPEDRGARAGIHEAVVGAGNFSVPFLAGQAAERSGSTMAAGITAAAIAVGAGALAARRARTGPGNPPRE